MQRLDRFVISLAAMAALGSSAAAVAAPAGLPMPIGKPMSVNPRISVMRMLRQGHHIVLTPQERGVAASPVPASAPPVAPTKAKSEAAVPVPSHKEEAASPAAAGTAAEPADIPSGVVTVHSVQDVKKLGEELKRATEQMNRQGGN